MSRAKISLSPSRQKIHARRDRIEQVLVEQAGLGGFADRDPATLSGGSGPGWQSFASSPQNRAPCCSMSRS